MQEGKNQNHTEQQRQPRAEGPKLDVARMRDIVSELEMEGDIYSRINMQETANYWGLTIAEIYYLIDPIRA